MIELEDVFSNFERKNRKYNKEEWIDYKRKEKQDVYKLIDESAEKIVQNGEEFKKYLNTLSKFEQYSVANTLLINAQMPEAIMLKDFDNWTSIGGYPKKNRKPDIKILEPADTYMREDGSVGTNYNVKYLTDISQVNIRQRAREIRYDDKLLLKVFLQSSQARIEVVDKIENTDRVALYDFENDVLQIARCEDRTKLFNELTQELAKQEIGENCDYADFKVNAVSYMICKKYNLNFLNYNITDIPYGLTTMPAKEIREQLEPIHDSMESISGRISHNIESISRQNREKEQAR